MSEYLTEIQTFSGETTLDKIVYASLLKRGPLQKERICSQGKQILSFLSRPLSDWIDVGNRKSPKLPPFN